MVFSLFSKKPPSWIEGYPPYDRPFAAAAGKLTDEQADANLEYFLNQKSTRVTALAKLLTGFDIDVIAGMNAASPDALVTELYNWSGKFWPQYFDNAVHSSRHWIASEKHEANLIYSVVNDTAIVIGDLIIKHRPTYAWGLDRSPENKLMTSYNRVVLTAPWLPEPDKTIEVDVEGEVVQRFLCADFIRQKRDELWLKLVRDCVSGGAEGIHLGH